MCLQESPQFPGESNDHRYMHELEFQFAHPSFSLEQCGSSMYLSKQLEVGVFEALLMQCCFSIGFVV